MKADDVGDTAGQNFAFHCSLPLLDVTGRKTTVVSETTDLHMNSLVHVIGKGSEDVGKLGHSLADFFPEEVQH